ncbi:MAG: DNA polymerase III subunit [Oscillospiraceae bacterium]|nr:DNA polymerase III subunit [Oscillospiraceae bacterium]
MAFDTLLGNDRLKANLAESLAKGHISHFYLISGPEGSGKHTLAKLLAAAILCQEKRRPCLRCNPCRKVLEGNHPDFITVDDPEKKTVTVDLIRQARADIYVQPNESDHKIYLFPRAQDMGVPGQNALLKILEEPPKYGVFLLLTDNPDKLLPTVRSRCTELKMQALPEDVLRKQLRLDFPQASDEDLSAAVFRSGGFLGQARMLLKDGGQLPPQTEQLVEALCKKDSLLLVQTLTPMEKWKRDALLDILKAWLEILENAMLSRSGIRVLSPQARQLAQLRPAAELHGLALTLKKAIDYAQSNVSPAAVCGWLAWELR